jgi:hypothetical protein
MSRYMTKYFIVTYLYIYFLITIIPESQPARKDMVFTADIDSLGEKCVTGGGESQVRGGTLVKYLTAFDCKDTLLAGESLQPIGIQKYCKSLLLYFGLWGCEFGELRSRLDLH